MTDSSSFTILTQDPKAPSTATQIDPTKDFAFSTPGAVQLWGPIVCPGRSFQLAAGNVTPVPDSNGNMGGLISVVGSNGAPPAPAPAEAATGGKGGAGSTGGTDPGAASGGIGGVGATGVAGIAGNPGGAGGSITITVAQLAGLVLRADGGVGGDGQAGQQGGPGGPGGDPGSYLQHVFSPEFGGGWVSHPGSGGPQGPGGPGGLGGAAAAGGAGGTIVYKYSSSTNPAPTVVMSANGGNAGQPGAGGTGGPGSSPGGSNSAGATAKSGAAGTTLLQHITTPPADARTSDTVTASDPIPALTQDPNAPSSATRVPADQDFQLTTATPVLLVGPIACPGKSIRIVAHSLIAAPDASGNMGGVLRVGGTAGAPQPQPAPPTGVGTSGASGGQNTGYPDGQPGGVGPTGIGGGPGNAASAGGVIDLTLATLTGLALFADGGAGGAGQQGQDGGAGGPGGGAGYRLVPGHNTEGFPVTVWGTPGAQGPGGPGGPGGAAAPGGAGGTITVRAVVGSQSAAAPMMSAAGGLAGARGGGGNGGAGCPQGTTGAVGGSAAAGAPGATKFIPIGSAAFTNAVNGKSDA